MHGAFYLHFKLEDTTQLRRWAWRCFFLFVVLYAAVSTYASVGDPVTLEVAEEPESPISMVTVPGSLNDEMGCAGDDNELLLCTR